MKRLCAALALSCLSPFASAVAEEAPAGLESQADKINYSVGFRVGSDFKGQGEGLSHDLLVKAVQDAVSGTEPLMSQEEMRATLAELQRKMVEQAAAQRQKDLAGIIDEGRAFLAENGRRAGVVTLPSGLQYEVIEPGTGPSPTLTDQVSVHYRGTLVDGTEFDSSYQRGNPAAFPLQGVIAGWTEALQLMRAGARWKLFVPSDLAYGDKGKLAERTLIFDVRLLSVIPGGPHTDAAPQSDAPKPEDHEN